MNKELYQCKKCSEYFLSEQDFKKCPSCGYKAKQRYIGTCLELTDFRVMLISDDEDNDLDCPKNINLYHRDNFNSRRTWERSPITQKVPNNKKRINRKLKHKNEES